MELSTSRPLIVARAAKEGFGEDAYAVGKTEAQLVYLGVFDGCGGLGGRRYEVIENHTGAWTASRVVAYTTETFLRRRSATFDKAAGKTLQNQMFSTLQEIKSIAASDSGIQIVGDLKRSFPTTVSLAITQPEEKQALSVSFLWSGDSRGYILDDEGLCQLTTDDIDANGDDAFLNLREDGRLTNVANADKNFELHMRTISIAKPTIVLTATDGCFAYFKTPMEFEHLLLSSLQESETPQQFCACLDQKLKPISGDDYTMAVGFFGFSDYAMARRYYAKRASYLKKEYIIPAQGLDMRGLLSLWHGYRKTYYRKGLSWE